MPNKEIHLTENRPVSINSTPEKQTQITKKRKQPDIPHSDPVITKLAPPNSIGPSKSTVNISSPPANAFITIKLKSLSSFEPEHKNYLKLNNEV